MAEAIETFVKDAKGADFKAYCETVRRYRVRDGLDAWFSMYPCSADSLLEAIKEK